MKICSKCGQQKSVEEFAFRNKAKNIRRAECKACVRSGDKVRYQDPKRKAEIRENAARRRQELTDKVWAYKQGKKCADCPQTDPRTFEFDHLPGFKKTANISKMVTDLIGWSKILEEIQKCEIVCASCHRIRTHERGKWVRNVTIICE